MTTEASDHRPRLVGLNHIALDVGDIEEALAFYGQIFSFTLRNKFERMAFIDIGDQFIALAAGDPPKADGQRHVGLVVDSKAAAQQALDRAGVSIVSGPGIEFRDPWGNLIQIVEYSEIQFSKAPGVLRGMGLDNLEKTPEALAELEAKGLA